MTNVKNRRDKKAPQPDLKATIDEEIDKAMKSVAVTKFRTEELHQNWRNHLFRLSAGVVLLSMHQYSQPVKECILDLKSVQPEIEVAPVTAMKLIFSDGLVELVNFIISLCLLRFNSLKEKGDYSSRSYMLASALIPFCLGLFFNTERYGCVTDSNGEVILGANSVMTERQFPVSAVFHIIVTGCYWFMNMSMAQCDLNLEAVTRLQKELSSKNSRKKK